ncbi:hypothetical protein V6R21_13815 [Limibacter armeniacum]|uniref:hypothetical protein n=1 Tax=Limibacter armeniacum TaxID=466084 RepID=UPI002FE517F9
MGMNLTGSWIYEEDFGYGMSRGVAELVQVGNKISGSIQLREEVDGEDPFTVVQQIEGSIQDDRVVMVGVSYEVKGQPENFEYCLDSWDGQLTNKDLIVGESEDSDGLIGIFVFKRQKPK